MFATLALDERTAARKGCEQQVCLVNGTGHVLPVAICIDCKKSAHQACIGYTDKLFKIVSSDGLWQCSICKTCWVCQQRTELGMVLCDDCDRGYHIQCMSPPRTEVPPDDWSCEHCALAKALAARRSLMPKQLSNAPSNANIPYPDVISEPKWCEGIEAVKLLTDPAVKEIALRIGRLNREESMQLFSTLQGNHTIKTLRLKVFSGLVNPVAAPQSISATFTHFAFQSMADVGSLVCLQLYDMDYTEVNPAVFKTLMQSNKQLAHLYFIGTNNGLSSLLTALRKTEEFGRIETIVVDAATNGTSLHPVVSDILRSPMCAVTAMSLRYLNVDKDITFSFADALHTNTSLQTLIIGDSRFSKTVEVNHIANAIRFNKTLKVLNLIGCNINNSGAELLANALKTNKHLRGLALTGNSIKEEGVRKLSESIRLAATIVEFGLNDNQIGDEGASHVAALIESCTSIRELFLAGNRIRSIGAIKIASALQRTNTLTALDLSDNAIGSALLQLMNGLKMNHSIIVLNLSKTQLDVNCAALIADMLLYNNTLQLLLLMQNNLSRGVVAMGPALAYNKSLKWVNLQKNMIDTATMKQFLQSLPAQSNLTIYLQGNEANVSQLTEFLSKTTVKIHFTDPVVQEHPISHTQSNGQRPAPVPSSRQSATKPVDQRATRHAAAAAAPSATPSKTNQEIVQSTKRAKVTTEPNDELPLHHLVDLRETSELYSRLADQRTSFAELTTPVHVANDHLSQLSELIRSVKNASQPPGDYAEQRLLPAIRENTEHLPLLMKEATNTALTEVNAKLSQLEKAAQSLLSQVSELINHVEKNDSAAMKNAQFHGVNPAILKHIQNVANVVAPVSARVNVLAAQLAEAMQEEKAAWMSVGDDIIEIDKLIRNDIVQQLSIGEYQLTYWIKRLQERQLRLNDFSRQMDATINELTKQLVDAEQSRYALAQLNQDVLEGRLQRQDVKDQLSALENQNQAAQANIMMLQQALMSPFVHETDD